MYEVLKGILVDDLQVREEDILPTATCEEVGLDSLAALELAEVLNARLGIRIQDYELLDTTTLAEMAHLVAERKERA
ncbi:acyl carrier protein [Streptomyces sp. NPDC004074]|uniref:acyl carrier protein n=1 Tax=Streptomyces sp. NPDC004074 TaxID=3154277 RepID=UPI0033B69C38